jgi:hypothetical protein
MLNSERALHTVKLHTEEDRQSLSIFGNSLAVDLTLKSDQSH